ncbi:MAG: hypothetical protein JJU02_16290 [Cryomorphaceae bacterium]|nr:hypothetical protein [Cryomorphaceae bacterium]
MTDPKTKTNEFDSSNIVMFAWKWRKPLAIVSITAAVVAIIFSSPYFIKPRFKSTVVVFPSTTYSVSKALLPQQNVTKSQDVLEFGEEQQADQLLQILHSDEIRQRIIDKYDLMNHYQIKENHPYRVTQLYKKYESNISFRRTEFISVEIKVLDTSPDTAAAIANDIAALLDEVKTRIQRERAEKALKIVEDEYIALKTELKQMEDELTNLRYRGVHDYETQAAALTEQLGQAIITTGAKSDRTLAIQNQLDTLAKYGGLYVSLRDEAKLLQEEFVRVKTKFAQAKVDVNTSLPTVFTVNTAFPAERKTYPLRSLIVVVSFFSALLFTLIIIIVVETIRKNM